MNNKYIKGRGASINYLYKKLRFVHAAQEKKSVCLAVRIHPLPLRIVVGGYHKNIFQLLTRSFYERKNEYHLSSQW